MCTVFENHRKSLINIASEASYIYILTKMDNFGEFLWSNSVTRQVKFVRTNIGGKCQN